MVVKRLWLVAALPELCALPFFVAFTAIFNMLLYMPCCLAWLGLALPALALLWTLRPCSSALFGAWVLL